MCLLKYLKAYSAVLGVLPRSNISYLVAPLFLTAKLKVMMPSKLGKSTDGLSRVKIE